MAFLWYYFHRGQDRWETRCPPDNIMWCSFQPEAERYFMMGRGKFNIIHEQLQSEVELQSSWTSIPWQYWALNYIFKSLTVQHKTIDYPPQIWLTLIHLGFDVCLALLSWNTQVCPSFNRPADVLTLCWRILMIIASIALNSGYSVLASSFIHHLYPSKHTSSHHGQTTRFVCRLTIELFPQRAFSLSMFVTGASFLNSSLLLQGDVNSLGCL